ncbi:trans-sulfuration enzyme family protein [Celeribacter halophilus]|uniref:trans-sulfuration enzyme family protein n=1 Tax=Celeribacter halophilus TaxID=576117 RepID=UPI001C09CA43|nr:PLP-dependent aspartate aminotransferase family protein [Celeribacter halophilus]MBU2888122.1 PLP-dependent aspartate aminotransferase family protein [Celeribacter halophilus]MDO6511868.1 PLP-dependent aspartate aminotransferase family protein [Celeribacter halophilus]
MTNDQHPDTLAATALGWIDRETDAMAAPLRPSTSFLRDPAHLDRTGRKFTRDDNPSYLQAEALINALEGGAGCLLFSSGMAAITAVFQRLMPGDHVILPVQVYSGLRDWLEHHGKRWGLEVSYLPDYTPATIEAAIIPGKTKIVWMETPSNPTWTVSDIAAIVNVAHKAEAIVGIDNTVSTPILTQPIRHGADLVLHSGSKYLNGHGDLIAGAAVVAPGREDLLADMKTQRNHYGAILGSFEAWLLLRGMRTLALRVRAQSASALKIAKFLENHPAVVEVLYPGLPSHAGHDIALRQMAGGFGGMLSFCVAGGETAAKAVAARVGVIRQAISFGSTETVIEHRAGMEGPDSPTPRDLLRISVGLENIDDLIGDLGQALEVVITQEEKRA